MWAERLARPSTLTSARPLSSLKAQAGLGCWLRGLWHPGGAGDHRDSGLHCLPCAPGKGDPKPLRASCTGEALWPCCVPHESALSVVWCRAGRAAPASPPSPPLCGLSLSPRDLRDLPDGAFAQLLLRGQGLSALGCHASRVHVLALCLGRGIFLPGPLPLVRKIGRADGARPPGQLWGDAGLRPSLRQSV